MKQIAVLVLLLALSACSLPVFFRVPVAQGNIVTADQVAKLRMGMNKKQVQYVLGTPLIKPAFEKDRWDYVFYYRNPRAHVRHSKLNLYFTNGKLSDIDGNEEYAAQVAKLTRESSAGDNAQSPDQTGSGNPSLSPVAAGQQPVNAGEQSPRGNSQRPGTQTSGGIGNEPNSDSRAPGNHRPLPHAGAPLPGNPTVRQQ